MKNYIEIKAKLIKIDRLPLETDYLHELSKLAKESGYEDVMHMRRAVVGHEMDMTQTELAEASAVL